MGLPLPYSCPHPSATHFQEDQLLTHTPCSPSHGDLSLHSSCFPGPSPGSQPAAQPTSEQKWDGRDENSHFWRRPMGWESHTIISLNPRCHEAGAGIAISQVKRLRLKEVKPLPRNPQKEAGVPQLVTRSHRALHMSVHPSSPFQAPPPQPSPQCVWEDRPACQRGRQHSALRCHPLPRQPSGHALQTLCLGGRGRGVVAKLC